MNSRPAKHSGQRFLTAGLTLVTILTASVLWAQEPAVKPATVKAAASASPNIDKPEPKELIFPKAGKDDCAKGVILDDGTVEGGLGYFTNLELGEIVQRFESPKLSAKNVKQVCVGLFSNEAQTMIFEVVFYRDENGRPAATPFAAVAAESGAMPRKMAEAGRFYSVDISDVTLPEGPSFIGVRWNPKLAARAFVALDKSEGEGRTPVPTFHRDTQSKGWDDLLTSKDFIYKGYQSALIRVLPGAAKAEK